MEQILKMYDSAEDDGFMGHDNVARDILNLSSKKNLLFSQKYFLILKFLF